MDIYTAYGNDVSSLSGLSEGCEDNDALFIYNAL